MRWRERLRRGGRYAAQHPVQHAAVLGAGMAVTRVVANGVHAEALLDGLVLGALCAGTLLALLRWRRLAGFARGWWRGDDLRDDRSDLHRE